MIQSIGGIIVAILLVGVMATVHELGHFLAGKKLGFKIISFQIFLGPKLFSWKKNDIEYKICLFPLGAAVQFDGEYSYKEDELVENKDPRAFTNKKKWQRAVVLLAGPFMNIVTGLLALMIVFSSIGYFVPTVKNISEQGLLAEQKIVKGDQILSINHKPIYTDLDVLGTSLFGKKTNDYIITYRHDDQIHTITIPKKEETRYMMGVSFIPTADQKAEIVDVSPNSNAKHPILQKGDILLKINDQAVSIDNLTSVLSKQKNRSNYRYICKII